jgi:hypothetical protein
LPYDQPASGAIIYAYVGGNPVNRIDPTGQFFVLPWIAPVIVDGVITAGEIIGGAIVGSTISDILDEIIAELEKKKKAENEANCPSDNNDSRCKKVLESCRSQCSDVFVDDPNKLPGSGSDMFGRIRRCIRECAAKNGCNNF